jgi:hypothetical protein
MPGNGHVRFGGRAEETDWWKRQHRASVRPYVRHEAPCDRVEVRGLHRRAVAAAG